MFTLERKLLNKDLIEVYQIKKEIHAHRELDAYFIIFSEYNEKGTLD